MKKNFKYLKKTKFKIYFNKTTYNYIKKNYLILKYPKEYSNRPSPPHHFSEYNKIKHYTLPIRYSLNKLKNKIFIDLLFNFKYTFYHLCKFISY